MSSTVPYEARRRHTTILAGWGVGVVAFVVYRLTMAPTVSFWDCGEFIATSYTLGVGHPPGAPVYQLLAHLFTLMAVTPEHVAIWSNMLSVVAGAATAMFLFWTVYHMAAAIGTHRQALLAAAVGAMAYCFSDTAWFSAVESEVYSVSMLFSSVIVWATVRWYFCADGRYAPRWMVLIWLMLGLSVCVHLMGWLALPAVILAMVLKCRERRKAQQRVSFSVRLVLVCAFFFLLGLTPYVIVPLRAAAHPTINNTNPATAEAFKSYIARDQYAKAPAFYPRIWRHHPGDGRHYAEWSGAHGGGRDSIGRPYYKPNVADNMQFLVSYQLTYMYLRYFMWNFSGRFDDRQGFGTLQHGQFVTGIPPIDRFLVGTGHYPPSSTPASTHNVYFLLPLLLGIGGALYQQRRQRGAFWAVMAVFLLSGVGLAVYLNMPAYQPRERDYAFVLSFYAFSIWIGLAVVAVARRCHRRAAQCNGRVGKRLYPVVPYLLVLVPLWMLVQNYDDHDRSDNYIARDTARNMLNSCNQGAILFTVGDNDTFPLWYAQEVEGWRKDVRVVNLNLLTLEWYASQVLPECRHAGTQAFLQLIQQQPDNCYFSHYAREDYRRPFNNCFQLTGMVYRLDLDAYLSDEVCDSVDSDEAYRHLMDDVAWQVPDSRRVGVDATSQKFLNQYCRDVVTVAAHLAANGREEQAAALVGKMLEEIPLKKVDDLALRYRMLTAAGPAAVVCPESIDQLRRDLQQQLDYYHSLSERHQCYIPYTLEPLEKLSISIQNSIL